MSIAQLTDRSMAATPNAPSIPKREKFKWSPLNDEGTFMRIDKRELRIDLTYQRDQVSEIKVVNIARDFNWHAFGALAVVMREDGFYVTDGGHRLRGAMMRDDVSKVPCLVFESAGAAQEAADYLVTNTMTSNVNAIDKFKAQLVKGDSVAQYVKEVVERSGYEICKQHGRYRTKIVSAFIKSASRSRKDFTVAFELVAEICDGDQINANLFGGIDWLVASGCKQILLKDFRDKLISLGQDAINASIIRERHLTGIGGARSSASTILKVLNKGRRTNKIEIPD